MSSCLSSYAIQYKEFGDPNAVLEKVQHEVSESLQSNEILIKMLATPVNPADIIMIQGAYGKKFKLPAIGGYEGVAKVVKVGSSVKNFQVGSWVIPIADNDGIWKNYGVYTEDLLIKIDETLPLSSAATLWVNPPTAYRMLKDFEDLKEGSTVIQNGANSAVGQAVIQIAKHFKINTINVIRDRPNVESLKSYLTDLGATYVVVENELQSPIMADILKSIPKPILGLNCVGGKSAAELIRHMADGGTLVSYGAMSKQPLMVNTISLIFNDIRLRGFWMTKWKNTHSKEEAQQMINEITNIVKEGHLKPPIHRFVKFDNFKEAVAKAMEPFVTEKQILSME
ncbi:Enoyl-[acyl-carrier-protein] reductase, mitochondrial [Araneus ventricosus]|uniref:Enoyl-[acyl-carrier-protein] reductase, mitochondrial n=1 Tax=Araneus ventricosus TaxID=182803 RepID=A0A4Y2QI80_ARAVE|nr:Enoyl-[acyl-carrier-protein] reductase, mitochondrial [Araneus ventricosus]